MAERASRRGWEVRALAGDVRDRATTAAEVAEFAPDAVIHLAGGRRGAAADGWGLLCAEIEMAGNIVHAVHQHTPDAVVLAAGSAAQYGRASNDALDESAPLSPVSEYGAIKTLLERALSDPCLNEGVRLIWARTFNCIGPGQQPPAPAAEWAAQIAEAERAGGGVIRAGRLDVVRDFLDVRDVADAYLALLVSDLEGPVNVGSGEGVVLDELLALMVARASVPLSVEVDPVLRREGDPEHVVADVGLLRSRTGWRRSIGLGQSVDDMLEDARTRVTQGAGR